MKMRPEDRSLCFERLLLNHNVVVTQIAERLRMRALVVHHEPSPYDAVRDCLSREGFDVHHVRTGEDALVAALVIDPDVVLLDVELPGIDGNEVCRRLRLFTDCYVVMVGTRDVEAEMRRGLSAGADDVLAMPISTSQLVASLHGIGRQPVDPEAVPTPTPALLTIDRAAREVRVEGRVVALTRTEFDLLTVLADAPLLTFTRGALVEAVWGDAAMCDEQIVDAHVTEIRRKLGPTGASQTFVRTIGGIGYRIGPGA